VARGAPALELLSAGGQILCSQRSCEQQNEDH